MTGVALLLLSASVGGQDERRTQTPVRLCPVDEALADESLVQFREALRSAAQAYDVGTLRPLVAEDAVGITVGDRDDPVVRFETFTRHDASGEPSGYYWSDFVGILLDGWVMESGGTFCAPYYTCRPPPGGWQRDEILVPGADLPAYARPEPDSPEVARLSCDVLRAASGDDTAGIRPDSGWRAVHLPPGGVGFIVSYRVMSPGLMVRVGKRNGVWKVIELRSYR